MNILGLNTIPAQARSLLRLGSTKVGHFAMERAPRGRRRDSGVDEAKYIINAIAMDQTT